VNDIRSYDEAVAMLRRILAQLQATEELAKVARERDQVLARFQPIFAEEHLPQLRQDEFHAFLLLENNCHWSGLQRHSPKMCADMAVLRDALGGLINESQPVGERIDQAVAAVRGMGKAVATAILLVVFPDRYGVWNSTSEGGLKALNLWPRFDRGESLGSRYVKVNEILNRLAGDLQVDLWTLDTLWWEIEGVSDKETGDIPEGTPATVIDATQRFSLERHWQDFLWDNWRDTSLGDEWDLYSEPGDPDAGYEYPCGVGRIDLLARHKSRPDWLVIELKRGQTSDATVGQVLRYMGWIKTNLAEPGEEVYGLVVAHEADEGLRYALSTLPSVDMLRYEVKFQLHPVSQPEKERA
jgi:hypothetical protein